MKNRIVLFGILLFFANTVSSQALTLQEKLNYAQPGDVIICSGEIAGPIATSVNGTKEHPIVLQGVGNAAIKGSGTDSGKGLTIRNNYYIVRHLVISTFEKGLWIEGAHHVTVDDLIVQNIGHEGVKIKGSSTYISIKKTIVRGTGKAICDNPSVDCGESFYVGDDADNWPAYDQPDTSSYILFDKCESINATANGFDFKEGAHDIKVRNSTISNSGEASVYTRANDVQFINVTSITGSIGSSQKPAFKLFTQEVNGVVYGGHIELKRIVVIDDNSGSAVQLHNSGIAQTSFLYDDYSVIINHERLTIAENGFFGSGVTMESTDSGAFVENFW